MKKNIFNKPVMVLRKKLEGENSIEEIAYHFKRMMDIELIILPCYSRRIKDVIKNICFIRNIDAPVFHLISTEAYLLPFINTKKIITYHDLGTINNSRNWLYKIMRRILFIYPSSYFSDYITFISNESRLEYINFMKNKKDNKLRVIYNPYDERLIPVKHEKNKRFTILHIGTAERKNLLSTIEACKGLDIKLIVIGKLSSTQLEALHKYKIDYTNLYDINYQDIVNYYNLCDLVSFPSSYEGFGVPIVEANVMRKPIFAGDIPILHEVANDSAIFVNPYNVNEVREVIVRLMDDESLREELIKKGIINAIRFQQDKIIKQYEELYYD